ncbi:hypothetical protein A5740_13235 [Mycobacterium sp. GA-1841]|nr:hypothetical protein A5740_13235 [Mycobacterium sp. GA-1841]
MTAYVVAPIRAGTAYRSSGRISNGISRTSTSRMMPPPIAVVIPISTAANQLAPWSTAKAAPEVAKKPMPIASNGSTTRLNRMTCLAASVATAVAANATVMLGQC